MGRICILFLLFICISFALCDYKKYSNALVNNWNRQPDQPFVYDEANLLKALDTSSSEQFIEDGIPGGLLDQDPRNPKYKQLAEESLAKYVSLKKYKVIQINKVQTQVVAGIMTFIDFTAQGPSKVYQCHSDIFEQSWVNIKEIDVECNPITKRLVPGGLTDEDVNDPKFKKLAEESLAKFVSLSGSTDEYKIIKINRVQGQVVSGSMTYIDFTVQGPSNVLQCNSQIWEQSWLNKKEIDVKCNPIAKRQLMGGRRDKDPRNPKYTQLAVESLAKYVSLLGNSAKYEIIQINRVQEQTVNGLLIYIDFTVQGPSNVLECHSKIWEQSWLNKNEIDVKCNPKVSRRKRPFTVAPIDQDVNDPEFKKLAEESLAKYAAAGITGDYEIFQINKVQTQVVAGIMTFIDFTALGPINILDCHSNIFEQPWLNKKEIDVKCNPIAKRQVSGGLTDKDVNDPKFKKLAEESLAKFVSLSGSTDDYKIIKINRVQGQVVSGYMTYIDFTVQGPSNVLQCHSQIWEQSWLNKKEIDVKCNPN